jgi:hypothetical protein
MLYKPKTILSALISHGKRLSACDKDPDRIMMDLPYKALRRFPT